MHLHSSWNSLIVRGGRIKREEEEEQENGLYSALVLVPFAGGGKNANNLFLKLVMKSRTRCTLGKVFVVESETESLVRFFVVGRRANFPLWVSLRNSKKGGRRWKQVKKSERSNSLFQPDDNRVGCRRKIWDNLPLFICRNFSWNLILLLFDKERLMK